MTFDIIHNSIRLFSYCSCSMELSNWSWEEMLFPWRDTLSFKAFTNVEIFFESSSDLNWWDILDCGSHRIILSLSSV